MLIAHPEFAVVEEARTTCIDFARASRGDRGITLAPYRRATQV
jgi:hypothetical protein